MNPASMMGGARTVPWSRVAYFAAAAGVVLLAFALRYPSLYEPRWYGDEGIFAAIAQNMRQGRLLYGEAWDNKPPLIFLTYAGVQAVAGNGVYPLHLTATLVVLATQVAVMAVAAMLFGGARALAAGLAFAFVMGTPLIEGNLAMTETFMILPTTLAALTFVLAQREREDARTRHYVAAGLLIGVAVHFKQVAVFDGAAIGLMIWLTHARPWRALAPLAAGIAVPVLASLLFFAAVGAAGDYWYGVVGSLGLYSGLTETSPVARFAGMLPALLVFAWMARRRALGESIGVQSFPMLWLGFALAGATSSSLSFPHYLQQAAPAFALTLAGLPLPERDDATGRALLGVAAALAVAVVFGQFSFAYNERRQLDAIDYYRDFASYRWGTMSELDYYYRFDGKAVAVKDIAAYIDEDGAGDTAFTWSELPWIYPAAEMENPARYYTSFLGELVPGAKDEILRDLRDQPPAYVILSDAAYAPFDDLEGFVEDRYTLLRAQGDWRLYRLATLTGWLAPQPTEARGAP